ncbi:helix-turn-helix domain-containing protein [Cohnella faecalis]|nr:helix-turn-helix transcriptional regulator [Cohnella faecalis]
MNFGEKLTRLREQKGLSQYEVAERLGIKRPRYNAWEQSLAKPRADLLNLLATFFEVSPSYLLGFNEEDTPQQPEPPFEPGTIAAHHEGEDWSEEEQEDIRRFKEFLKSKRINK